MKFPGKMTRRILMVCLVAALLVVSVAASSVVTKKMIEANYVGVRIVVDGLEITPKDANGATVDPFISEGTTYLPVRAVAEALGKEVTWVGETKTVYIGAVPGQGTNWMKELPPYQTSNGRIYDGSDLKQSFSVAGVPRTLGVVLNNTNGSGGYAIWNTNGLYQSMTFTVGAHDGTEGDRTLDVYLDNELLTTYELKWASPAQTITVPLNYASNVRLVLNHGGGPWAYYGFYDISFSKDASAPTKPTKPTEPDTPTDPVTPDEPGEVNWMQKLPPYQNSNGEIFDGSDLKRSFSVAGVSHTLGVVLHNNNNNGGYVIWNTNGLYKSMTFTVGAQDGTSGDRTLDVYLDGVFSTSYELKWASPAQTITIPLNYASNVRLVLNHGGGSWAYYGFYDISFSEQ